MSTAVANDLLNLSKAAECLGVSRPHIRRLIERGELTGFRSALDRRAKFVRAEDLTDLKSRAIVALNNGEEGRRQGAAAA
jgi:excisionase family DNA binding protein